MPLLLDTAQSGPASEVHAANCVTIGLINNMPDGALEATERQFTDLIRASADNTVVRLMLFCIPELPRSDATRREMSGRYRDIAELWNTPLDGLIVTGTEPKSDDLKDEPYWDTLGPIIDWAREHTYSTIWSCLAAHAAVLKSDGIERNALPQKLSGIFECTPAISHPITQHIAVPLRIPHSRWNGLSEQSLQASGYRILTRSAAAGVDMFARQERSFHVFLQGHPEYEPGTLLREYRRDVGRYLRGEREHYPEAPQDYFDAQASAAVEAFRARALADRRGELLASFPLRELEAGLAGGWRASAVAIYANWFEYLKGRKAEQHLPLSPMRRSWRDWPGGRVRQAAADSSAN
jgi:homoserine O-succinyltransferase/O-acetyltransferase